MWISLPDKANNLISWNLHANLCMCNSDFLYYTLTLFSLKQNTHNIHFDSSLKYIC